MTDLSESGWRCPKNEAGEGFGFNESGMEHFTGDPFSAIAREITQNTNDAKISKPAYLDFRLLDVPAEEFPSRSDYQAILEKCETVAKDESEKAHAFFRNALELIKAPSITFLVARDRNTTGISGPCKKGTPYHAFMKSTGTSKKNSVDSGGSFGIGKNAPFAMSDLHLVFVVTTYRDDDGRIVRLAQGKSILMSHGMDGTEFTNNAYWGASNSFGPLEGDHPEIPTWMTNPFGEGNTADELGTTLYYCWISQKE